MHRTRSWRRSQKDRYTKKAQKYYRDILKMEMPKKRDIGVRSNTRCLCSLSCCGNPRKHFKAITFQESKNLWTFDEELKYYRYFPGKDKNDPRY